MPISTPHFNIRDHDAFLARMKSEIKKARTRVKHLKQHGKDDFSFIIGLENHNQEVMAAAYRLGLLRSVATSQELEKLDRKTTRLIKKFEHFIYTDPEIYQRINRIWRNRKNLNLNPQQTALIREVRDICIDYGARLGKAKRQRIAKIDTELELLQDKFDLNIMAFEDAHPLVIKKESDLEGLPERVRQRARQDAQMYGYDGWLFGLEVGEQDIFMKESAFMRYSTNSTLREKLWRRYIGRCHGGRFDNMPHVPQIIKLRDEWARIVGHENYAQDAATSFRLKTPEAIIRYLDTLKGPALAAAKQDYKQLQEFAFKTDGVTQLQPWDVMFYQEKLRKEIFGFDSQKTSEYFPLKTVLEGMFDLCHDLFGIYFREKKYPTWHKDVKTFEAVDEKTGKCRGILFADLFAREGKNSGAWSESIRDRQLNQNGSVTMPLTLLGGNFTPPVGNTPSLLTVEDVIVLFHEMGHAIEHLSKDVDYPTIGVLEEDTVELPAIFFEKWAWRKDVLKKIGRHYKTKTEIPDYLADAIHRSQHFMAGWDLLHHLQKSYLDMALHTTPPRDIGDIHEFERKIRAPLRLLPDQGECLTSHFTHSIAGHYAAGFFGYEYSRNEAFDLQRLFGDNATDNRRLGRKLRHDVFAKSPLLVPNGAYRIGKGARGLIRRRADPFASLTARGLIASRNISSAQMPPPWMIAAITQPAHVQVLRNRLD